MQARPFNKSFILLYEIMRKREGERTTERGRKRGERERERWERREQWEGGRGQAESWVVRWSETMKGGARTCSERGRERERERGRER